MSKSYVPNEDALEFKKRHGVDIEEHLAHAEETLEFARSLGFNLGQTPPGKVAHSNLPPFGLYHAKRNVHKINKTIEELYVANVHGLRSDEFFKHEDMDQMHTLFAGCSMTFGDGVPLDALWAHKLYTTLNDMGVADGYFNVAQNGASSIEVLLQTYNYIYNFGMPSKIFIMLPDMRRDLDDDRVGNKIVANNIFVSMYNGLVKLCNAYGAKLYAFSWDMEVREDSTSQDIRRDLDRFFVFTDKQKMYHMYQFERENQGHEYKEIMLDGLDLVHPGIAEQDFYFSFILGKYLEEINV